MNMIGNAIIFGIAALILLFFVILATKKDAPETDDWINEIHRPCCKNCMRWLHYDVLISDTKQIRRCEKSGQYTESDFCCMNYTGYIDAGVYDDDDIDNV